MNRLHAWLQQRLLALAASRAPDRIIGVTHDPYLQRWHVIPRNPLLNIYLHVFLRSDDDRALHDHPWPSWSLLLDGQLVEQMPDVAGVEHRRAIPAGRWVFRGARAAHRIEVPPGCSALTLFVTGPRIREWGFLCPQGWRPWHQFVDRENPGISGPGCD